MFKHGRAAVRELYKHGFKQNVICVMQAFSRFQTNQLWSRMSNTITCDNTLCSNYRSITQPLQANDHNMDSPGLEPRDLHLPDGSDTTAPTALLDTG